MRAWLWVLGVKGVVREGCYGKEKCGGRRVEEVRCAEEGWGREVNGEGKADGEVNVVRGRAAVGYASRK